MTAFDQRVVAAAAFASPAIFGGLATADEPTPYRPANFHKAIGQGVVDVVEGRERLLVIQCPVQHGKTMTASMLTSTWFLGMEPSRYVVAASYSTDFAEDKIGAPARNMLELHGPRFFDVSVDRKSSARGRWDTNRGGGFLAAGVDKRIAGRRMDLAIVDDPVGGLEDVSTKASRDAVWNWFLGELYPRRAPGCGFIVVMSRWHQDDFVGRLLAWAPTVDLPYKLLDFPAIALDNDPLGRKPGEALWPAVRDIGFLEEQRRAMGTRRFDAQFQGRPHPEEGALFKREWFRYATSEGGLLRLKSTEGLRAVNLSDCRIYAMVDLATSLKTTADYFVITTFAMTRQFDLIVLNVVRERATAQRQLDLLRAQHARFRLGAIGIEDVGYQLSFYQLAESAGLPVRRVKVTADKVARAAVAEARMEGGSIYFLEGAPWLAAFEEELLAFPAGAHDDQVDTLSAGAQVVSDAAIIGGPASGIRIG